VLLTNGNYGQPFQDTIHNADMFQLQNMQTRVLFCSQRHRSWTADSQQYANIVYRYSIPSFGSLIGDIVYEKQIHVELKNDEKTLT